MLAAGRDFDLRGLVVELDAAVRDRSCAQLTEALRHTLCRLIREQRLRLPADVFEPNPDHYARREIYKSPDLGYTVIAMTWGPGQGTPVHDHSGLWCVEGVWDGELEIVQYELLEHDGNRYRFRAAGGMHAGPGSAGSLIPPHEYHTICNASADRVAISLHIYKAPMECCAKFVPQHGDRTGEWFVREDAQLTTDQAA